jgi:hypothetical protein
MKYFTTIVLQLIFNSTFAQTTFTVDNFSKDYYGEIFISDTSEVFSKGWIAIYGRKSKEQIINVNSEELALNLHDGKALVNIKELPYGEQSLIMYDDYNFDGVKDFAIEDGQNSCYHGPSFQIYLASNHGFVLSEDFTRLAQEYCGMFNVNFSEKRISTMTKSGCCWHQFSEFIVENNKPKAIKIIEDDQTDFPFDKYSEEIWNGKKMDKTSKRTIDLDEEGIKIVLSFKVDKNEKQIVLFNINNRTLNYALIGKDGSVEFSYPIESVYKNPDFKFDTKINTITFQNKDAIYKIYSDTNSIGIEINLNSKMYNWTGNINTKKGDLKDLITAKLDNVVIN